MATTKNILLRLDPALAEQLQAVADVEGRPVSEVAREAIRRLVAQRRDDPGFQQLQAREQFADHVWRAQVVLRIGVLVVDPGSVVQRLRVDDVRAVRSHQVAARRERVDQ